MSLTLIEYAKGIANSGTQFRGAIVEMFPANSELLSVLPFQTIQGNALKYNREETLPGIAFRGYNESYTESTGVINPITETLHILGGEADVDRQLVKSMGPGVRAAHVNMKVKSLVGAWTEKFIKGDNVGDPREFDGLQNRLTGSQVIDAGSTANGAALSLIKLDEAIDAVDNPTHILMNRTMKRRLSAAARLYTVGGYITYELGAFGRRVMQYNDLPIVTIDQDNEGNEILPFTEAAASGTDTACSIYVVSLGDGNLVGIQNDSPEAYDLGEIDSAPVYRTRVEWASGIAMFGAKSAARLRYIADAAVVA
jgi:hypothetical protein